MANFNDMNNLPKRKAKDINLKELFFVIKRRFWLIIVITVITTGLGAYYNHSHSNNTPLYQTSSRIFIGANTETRNTLQVIIKDSTVLDEVVKELGLPQSAEALFDQITVESVDNTQVVSISVIDSDPNRAAEIANKTAKVFIDGIPKIIPKIMDIKDVWFLSEAKVKLTPINQSQNQTKLVLIALIAGVGIGIGLIFLLDSLDDSIRSNHEVEEILGLPVLGRVSKMHKKNLKKKNIKQFELEVRGDTIGYK
ncbi:YveK family protein [Neobacillus vireti]|uniref:Lipopolysaccharide biosynthesis protein n=1 Tax=Neobacillus vireti LMG 21834 TaxID=1131730 RepID=A0AB94IKL3_9BACI|nr:Wzz/FepE/Etk N-terminal domain-containing protein [Neobacillus vireti]ETI67574.1 lipopolysaccharide biosynthesis protein [Neobacillus vireti LMG 21834]KLT18478.1 capsular biosynthesis protein [Neobacillus vireti]